MTGVDISENMLEIARQKSRIDISLVGDVTALPPEAARSFDIVTSAGVLDFIGNTDKLLSEAARVLKQGGLCGIIFEPDNAAGPGHKTISHNEDILKSQFAAHGFSVKKILRAPGIYTNFKTGAAVENVIMIASLDKV
ncbi:MAG: class I SAM-dependent methyltransferase [Alphaproteobacteria bacterium]|nr:class I SAM-dependent methyltransferase [Alphaproteobacteria bacterium]